MDIQLTAKYRPANNNFDCGKTFKTTEMTIDELANFAEFKDCTVSLGSSEVGFIQIDGTGVMSKFNNYRRFLAHNELASLPDRRKVLQNATTFRITRGTEIRELSREEFQSELDQFQQKLGI